MNGAFFSGVGSHKEVLMLEAPLLKIFEGNDTMVEGILEEVSDNNFEGVESIEQPLAMVPEPAQVKKEGDLMEINLDPRMLESEEKNGASGDTISILVDVTDPSKELKVGK